MNKKISTLFTAGLLVAGSLCGSAWAKDVTLPMGLTPLTKLTGQNQEVFMSIKDTEGNDLLYGFDKKENGEIIPAAILELEYNYKEGAPATPANRTGVKTTIDEDQLADYIWVVTWTKGATEYSYTLTNKGTGDALRIKVNGTDVEYKTNAAAIEGSTNLLRFVDGVEYAQVEADPDATPAVEQNKSGLLSVRYQDADKKMAWTKDGVTFNPSGNEQLLFYAVQNPGLDDPTELNALYNGNGFSFGTSETVEENLFSGKLYAYYLDTPLPVDDQGSLGYTAQAIPTGMYFFVTKPSSWTSYQAWKNATVLAVSSTETVEATATDRAKGQGFAVKAVKISDMNLYTNSAKDEWKSQGDEISIYNACFTVNKSYVESNPYALTLENFRYKAKSDEAKHETASVRLSILEHSDKNYLATAKNDNPQFIFKLAAANVQSGIALLNTEAKAAVFNIRIANRQNDGIEGLYGKYLTVGAMKNGMSLVPSYLGELAAKAKVLADLDAPAYQWVITEVTTDNDITFTNRETDMSFTAKLFPQATENVYELNVSEGNAEVYPIIVNQNTYNEEKIEENAKLLQSLYIALEPVEVDPLAGFLNVDDKTLMTMAFARDNYETSNKFYVAVDEYFQFSTGDREGNVFVNEASGAAQWQLVKSEKPMTIIERSFVYNNNNHVTVKAKADVAQAYTYQLRYVTDGEETDYFFPASIRDELGIYRPYLIEDQTKKLDIAPKFVIKENIDGSLYLIEIDEDTKVSSDVTTIFSQNTRSSVAAETYSDDLRYAHYDIPASIYTYPEEMDLKTYLIEEAPEVSYPAEEGYVYMKSEMGDYISMNADRDGIVVDENPFNLYLHVTDKDAVVPSFYISKGIEGSAERAYLFHPQDSVDYYAATGNYDREYMWNDEDVKAIFKVGTINATRDTIATMIKGEQKNVAVKADDNGVLGGLNNFKFQIVLADDEDDLYVVRSLSGNYERYLYAVNEKLTWTADKAQAMKFTITEGDPTANEAIANEVEGVKVIAGNGTVEIQGAAGKNVVIANILGKVVASTTLTSDNQTINVPAGIVVVTVDGEAVKAVVR